MIRISEKLRQAIADAAEDAGNPYQLSIKIGVTNATVGKWLKDKTASIRDETMLRLLPLVVPHLDKEELRKYHSIFLYTVNECKLDLSKIDETCVNVDSLYDRLEASEKMLENLNFYLSLLEKKGSQSPDTDTASIKGSLSADAVGGKPLHKKNESNAEFIKIDPDGKLFPVISEAAAVGINTAIYPLAEYLIDHAEAEKVYFSQGKEGDFVIRIQGESMMPWYPPGTLVLVRPNQRLKSGQRVVAITEDSEAIFKIFAEDEENVYLMSINDHGGKDFTYSKKGYMPLRGVWLVIQSMRDEMALDDAMAKAGIHHRWEDKIAKKKTGTT